MNENRANRIHPLAFIGALLFAALVLGLVYYFFKQNAAMNKVEQGTVDYQLTVYPAPTPTATVFIPTDLPTPTTEVPNILPEDAMGVGSIVKVIGTSGLGLNIRSAAGRGQPVIFLALDAEMFEIVDGPEVRDDFIWWKLEAPYDAKRSGWAAENYLELIKQETPAP